MIFSRIFTVVCLLVVFSTTAVRAEKRIALVIGNSAYTRVPALTNPKNDAKLMAETLESVGFDVVLAIDIDRRKMGRAVRQFGKKLRAAGHYAVGLFYYASHGNQAKGVNYLIPLDAEIDTVADLEVEAISASNILSQMEDAGNTLNLVILDACRDNPYKGRTRSSTRGLAKVQAASGSLVAFSAAPGQVAEDGNGKNSTYTQALVAAIKQPGLELGKVFRTVRTIVEEQTDGRQTPWEESSLKGDFHFIPPANQTAESSTLAIPGSAQIPIRRDVEMAYLDAVEKDTLAAYERFLIEFPDHSRAVTVRKIVRTRSDDRVWERTRKRNSRSAFRQYLIIFPDGAYSQQAQRRLAEFSSQDTTSQGTISEGTMKKRKAAKPQVRTKIAGTNIYRVIDHEDWDVLNVRRGPGTKYGKIFGIPYNADTVIVHNNCRKVDGFSFRWCIVEYNGRRGWAYARYLENVGTGKRPQ